MKQNNEKNPLYMTGWVGLWKPQMGQETEHDTSMRKGWRNPPPSSLQMERNVTLNMTKLAG